MISVRVDKVYQFQRKNPGELFRAYYVGRVDRDTATLLLQNAKLVAQYIKLRVLQIDAEILYTPQLHYKYMSFRYKGKDYITTRKYFWDKSTEVVSIENGVVNRTLSVEQFDLDKALAYEKELIQTKQLNLFERKNYGKERKTIAQRRT